MRRRASLATVVLTVKVSSALLRYYQHEIAGLGSFQFIGFFDCLVAWLLGW